MSEFGMFQLGLGKNSSIDRFKDSIGKEALNKQDGIDFMESLKGALQETNDAMLAADNASKDFAAGRSQDIHDLMITMEKADISLRTLTSVRNKVVEAYQEIMRMQV